MLDPIIDPQLKPNIYGFRKGRSEHQAIAKLTRQVELSKEPIRLIKIKIDNYYDNISHDYILNHFPFPPKHRFLLQH